MANSRFSGLHDYFLLSEVLFFAKLELSDKIHQIPTIQRK